MKKMISYFYANNLNLDYLHEITLRHHQYVESQTKSLEAEKLLEAGLEEAEKLLEAGLEFQELPTFKALSEGVQAEIRSDLAKRIRELREESLSLMYSGDYYMTNSYKLNNHYMASYEMTEENTLTDQIENFVKEQQIVNGLRNPNSVR